MQIDAKEFDDLCNKLSMLIKEHLEQSPQTASTNFAILNALAAIIGPIIASAPGHRRDEIAAWVHLTVDMAVADALREEKAGNC